MKNPLTVIAALFGILILSTMTAYYVGRIHGLKKGFEKSVEVVRSFK